MNINVTEAINILVLLAVAPEIFFQVYDIY